MTHPRRNESRRTPRTLRMSAALGLALALGVPAFLAAQTPSRPAQATW